MQNTVYCFIAACLLCLFKPLLALWILFYSIFTHKSSQRKIRHPWLSADKFDVIPQEKIHAIPNQEILGDIRPILWPDLYVKKGKWIVRRDLKTGRFVSLKNKANA